MSLRARDRTGEVEEVVRVVRGLDAPKPREVLAVVRVLPVAQPGVNVVLVGHARSVRGDGPVQLVGPLEVRLFGGAGAPARLVLGHEAAAAVDVGSGVGRKVVDGPVASLDEDLSDVV